MSETNEPTPKPDETPPYSSPEPSPLPLETPPAAKPSDLPPLIAVAQPPLLQPPMAARLLLSEAMDRPVAQPVKPSPLLIAATIAVGLLQLGLAIIVTNNTRGVHSAAYLVGALLGALVIWPLIVLGVFSIGRRFRNTRHRLIIVLSVWAFFILGHLGTIAGSGRTKEPAEAAAALDNEDESLDATAAGPVKEKPAPSASSYPEASEPARFDFTPGSDTRLIAAIDGAQKEKYQIITAAYIRACALRPADAVLALERVRFAERFAYSEDQLIEEAGDDHAAAVNYLKTQFPEAPGTVLYLLHQEGFATVETKAKSFERLASRWGAKDRAEFLLIRAQAAGEGVKPSAQALAKESFELYPTVAAGLLYAGKLQENDRAVECRQILMHAVFDSAEAWMKRQKLELLLKIKEPQLAAALYAEIKLAASGMVLDAEIAAGLAELGLMTEAREIFDQLAVNEWTREHNSLARFAFELKHGTEAQAVEAYRTLRKLGWSADPLWRYRYELFTRYPAATWNGADVWGVLVLGGFILFAALLPLGLLVPVHYWSLLRQRRGKSGGWVMPAWGLRQAWLLLALIVCTDFVVLWLLQPEEMRSWFGDNVTATDVIALPKLVSVQAVVWAMNGLLVAGLIWRRHAWSLFTVGRWSWGHCIAIGIGVGWGLRMLLGIYIALWPEAASGEVAAALSQTNQICFDLKNAVGSVGMILVIAVFVPLLEEAMFRGVLLQALGKHIPFLWANAGQALAFALVHENYRLIPFYFALGFACGEMARRSGCLRPGIVLHIFNNVLSSLAILFLHGLRS